VDVGEKPERCGDVLGGLLQHNKGKMMKKKKMLLGKKIQNHEKRGSGVAPAFVQKRERTSHNCAWFRTSLLLRRKRKIGMKSVWDTFPGGVFGGDGKDENGRTDPLRLGLSTEKDVVNQPEKIKNPHENCGFLVEGMSQKCPL